MEPEIKLQDGLEFLKSISKNTVDLVLTDPPYVISRSSGMNSQMNQVKKVEATGEMTYNEKDWEKYILSHPNLDTEKNKKNYLKFGSVYGKKYAVQTDYGEWDKEFTMEILEKFVKEFYRTLKKGGTCILWFDLWKITLLSDIMESAGFKQLRMIEWIKTNPQPRNSKVNYLTNCREIAILGIKGSKPTFNSVYDKGIYEYPLQGGKHRVHPTQKNQKLFQEIIEKHSNENDLVIDPFLGSGTTFFACQETKRNFKGCEINKQYLESILNRIKK